MPRTVDHEQRRSTILEAFIAAAARHGLHAVSMRSVAAEAGISLRLVQYYFGTKGRLMQAGLEHLERASNKRWSARLAKLPREPSAHDELRALFAEAMPTDRQSRNFHLLWTSYAVLAMTDAELGTQAFVEGPARLQRRIQSVLRRGIAGGELHDEIDVAAEADTLLALIHGFGTGVLVGQQRSARAMDLFERNLHRLRSRTPARARRPAASP